MINTHPKDITMKKLILMLAMTLALTLTANMARADSSLLFDWYDDFDKAVAAYNDDDYATAFKLIKPLAEQGDAEAQNNLWTMYHNGEGVLQDNKKAHMWYNIARANGEKEHAADNIERLTGGIFSRMAPADISEAQDMAERCLASNYQDC